MSKLNSKEINFLKLIIKSPDIGDGWRKVSDTLWPMVENFSRPELIKTDLTNKRVRFSDLYFDVEPYIYA